MSPELARRLARRAKRRRHNGFRGWLARAAWDRLVRAADDGDGHAIDAAWRLWKEDHGTDVLACLPRWWPSSVLRVYVLRYAVDLRQPAGWRAALGAFCAENGLVPADPVDRVRFFALTAQPARHRALDPDGTLLAIAYRIAEQATRKALRGAMTAAGDLDVVKVIAGGGEPGGDEVAYLTRHLAATGRWPELWRLVRDLPLPYAVASMNLLRDWEPHDPAERHVFERLMATGAGTVTEAARTLAGLRVTPIRSKAAAVSIATDRSGLAVVLPGGGIGRYTLPGMVFLGAVGPRPRRATRVLHLRESIVAVETGAGGVHRLVRYRTRSEVGETIWTSGSRHDGVWALAGARGRFFAAKSGELLLGTATTLRRVTRYELGLPAVFAFPLVLATEPATGRLAIGGRRDLDLSILSAKLRVIAHRRETGGGVRDVIFVGRDRLVTVDGHGWVMRWRRAGNTLRLDQSVQVPMGSSPADDRPSLCALPARGCFAVVGFDMVTWLDADTFATVDPPPGPRQGVDRLWASADGHILAVRYRDGRVELHNLLLGDVADLLDRPMSSMSPGSLATVRAAQRGHLRPEVGRTLALLRACLAHRVDTEISLGTTTRVRAAEDDIALGGVR